MTEGRCNLLKEANASRRCFESRDMGEGRAPSTATGMCQRGEHEVPATASARLCSGGPAGSRYAAPGGGGDK